MASLYIPPFLLQIVDQEDRVITLPAGGALEADLVELLSDIVLEQQTPRSWFRSHDAIRGEVTKALSKAILTLKQKTLHVVGIQRGSQEPVSERVKLLEEAELLLARKRDTIPEAWTQEWNALMVRLAEVSTQVTRLG